MTICWSTFGTPTDLYARFVNVLDVDLFWISSLRLIFQHPSLHYFQVGDLGLSKVKCKTLISGGVRGTLPWMAPELLNGSSSLVSEKA